MRLIESDRKKKRSVLGGVASIIFHATIIALVLFFTTRPSSHEHAQGPREQIIFIPQAPIEKQSPQPRSPTSSDPNPIAAKPKQFPTIIPPVDMPKEIPIIDFREPSLTKDDLLRQMGHLTGADSGKASPGHTGSDPYSVDEVGVPPEMLAGSPKPLYPEALRAIGVEGEVLAQFVVDENGRVELATLTILRSSHGLFEAAVRSAFPKMRFRPGEINGKKVRTRVQLPFKFTIKKLS